LASPVHVRLFVRQAGLRYANLLVLTQISLVGVCVHALLLRKSEYHFALEYITHECISFAFQKQLAPELPVLFDIVRRAS
jgi:hypothetical protein